MKRFSLLLAVALMSSYCMALTAVKDTTDTVRQDTFIFTTVKANPISSIKDQHRSGTCWCYSSLGFIESELMKQGKPEYDFDEMFVARKTYVDRAVNYVRLHGSSSFAQGGSFGDVFYCWKNYGMLPQSAYKGILYDDTLPNFNEMAPAAEAFVNSIAKADKLTPCWQNALNAIYDSYMGPVPEKFEYNGKQYDAKSFAASTGFNPDDYVSITSFTHHPFYTQFAIEVEDNWRMGLSYNVPLEDMMRIIDNALDEGYTILWGADVSEDGFTRNGLGVLPDKDRGAEITGSDMARWTKMTKTEKKNALLEGPKPQMKVTQEMRQKAFDNFETTDDHGMQLYGKAVDQNGDPYYMVKNSWGKAGEYDGIWYFSKPFVEYKTMNYVVNKNAIPKDIAKKLGLK